MSEDHKKATSRPAYVHSRRDFSSFLRVNGYKIPDNTITSLSGQATYEPNRSQKMADEMADGWVPLMTHFFDRPDAITAFLERVTAPIRFDDSNVTSFISPDDVGAALKKLKRGKDAGPDETNHSF